MKFERKDLRPYQEIVENSEKQIGDFVTQDFLGVKYKHAFEINKAFYEKTSITPNFKKLASVFLTLFNKASQLHFGKDYKFLNKEQFRQIDNKFKKEFKLDSREFLKTLRKDVNGGNQDEKHKYFRKFIFATVFFCANYNFRLVYTEEASYGVETLLKNDLLSKQEEYYFFYNRSKTKDGKIGFGTISFTGIGTNVEAEIYYSSAQLRSKNIDSFSSAKANGIFKEHTNSIITISLSDTKGGAYREHLGSYIQTTFILKKYNSEGEKIILGVGSFWNRNFGFPFSTAVVLVEKNYYDDSYPAETSHSFLSLLQNRSNHNIPTEIFYYIFRQTISLENSLESIKDSKGKPTFLSKLHQLPFYKSEGEYLERLAGRYKGISIVNNGQKNVLIFSMLEIFRNGEVVLKVKTLDENSYPGEETERNGAVKRIERLKGLTMRVFITLRYGIGKEYNSLNYFLDTKDDSLTGESTNILNGSFAGISIYSDKPTGSSIFFKKIAKDEEINIDRVYLDDPFVSKIKELYQKEKELIDLYLSKKDNYFSGSDGFNKLEKIVYGKKNFADEKQYEVFISIPLLHNESDSEYLRNGHLALLIKREIVEKFAIAEDKIFCGCLSGNQILPVDEYKDLRELKYKEFSRIKDIILNAKNLIAVFPKNSIEGRVSSAFIECGFFLGLNKGQNIIILFDKSERQKLPQNLIELNMRNSFPFATDEENSVRSIFITEFQQIKTILGV